MKIAQNFSTAYGGLAEHSKPALSAFSKRYNRNVQVCDDPRKGEPLIFTPSVPFLTCILTCISKNFPGNRGNYRPHPSRNAFSQTNKNPRKVRREATFRGFYFGATDPIRTDDLLITSELLYRLSHSSTLRSLQRVIFYHKSRELSRLIRNFIPLCLIRLLYKDAAQLTDHKAAAEKHQ